MPLAADQQVRADRSDLARERLYKLIKEQILSGALQPGTALSENLLARRYGVSRTPAREALHRLSLEGFVDTMPKRGTFVSQLPSARYVRQLYELREAVAGMAARLAAVRATPADVAVLRDLIARMAESADPEQSGQLADDFIVHIDRISSNDLLAAVNRNIMDQIHRLRQTVMRYDATYFDTALGRRSRLVDALESGDADAAEAVAREIVRHVRQDALRTLVER